MLATMSAPPASPSPLFYPTSVASVVSAKTLPESRTVISDSPSESFASSRKKVRFVIPSFRLLCYVCHPRCASLYGMLFYGDFRGCRAELHLVKGIIGSFVGRLS